MYIVRRSSSNEEAHEIISNLHIHEYLDIVTINPYDN